MTYRLRLNEKIATVEQILDFFNVVQNGGVITAYESVDHGVVFDTDVSAVEELICEHDYTTVEISAV